MAIYAIRRATFTDQTTIGKAVFVGTRSSTTPSGSFGFPNVMVSPKVLGEMILSLETILASVLLTMMAWVALGVCSMDEVVSPQYVDASGSGTTTILRAQKSGMPCLPCMSL